MKAKLSSLTAGGIVLGMSPNRRQFYLNTDDTHTLVIGATRSGKSRGLVLPSICTMALAGESMIVVDPKAELYLYTYPFLERMGYEVVTIDFKTPGKSNHYNFLQPVVDAVNQDNLPLAVSRARDIATMLTPDGKGSTDPIWTDGQKATLTMGILAVVVDNRLNPEYQNLSNAQQFIANMCAPVGPKGELPLTRYLDEKPAGHPVKIAMGIANIAPSKMRGSFYTSALMSLDLFTDPEIHTMTADTDFDLYATGREKRAIFIILPDEESTYYPLASLFVYQHYQTLVAQADKRGNRLQRRVNFVCDEFGNFVKIPDFDKFITVGGGRGIRFHLFLQDVNQLDEKYGEKLGKTIRANCETWVYLRSDDATTLRELSEKLGKYTIKSASHSGSTGGNVSASYNYTGRELLTAEEIGKIDRPYQLVTSRANPAILYAPDISKTAFQRLLGLGSKEHNIALIMRRDASRTIQIPCVQYWDIWEQYIVALDGPRLSAYGRN